MVIARTNHSKIIGLYSPDQWVDTFLNSEITEKTINNSKTFQFYFSDGELKIANDKSDFEP